ncbi:TPA: hypothetical protein ACGO3D_002458, partial [Streptococcus suis]
IKMFKKEEFQRLCVERDLLHPEDYIETEKKWDSLLLLISSEDDLRLLIDYMDTEMSGNEYGTLSEISDDIVIRFPSMVFIEAYQRLANKYPVETKRWNIQAFIDDASSIVSEKLEGLN